MKTLLILITSLFLCSFVSFSQVPVVYLNFVSHNEPKDSLQKPFEYFQSKNKCIQLANLITNKGAAWNIGTCDFFIDGAINHDSAITNPNDVFESLSNFPNSNIEIDARTKNHLGRNTADAVSMINSCGGTASNNLSGFTYYSSNLTQLDWYNYQDTLTGNTTGYKWKADVIWGAGSIPAHSHDLNDYGIWKPDTIGTSVASIESSFYMHNPSRNLWYIGNGCTSKLDTLSNEQDFITQLRDLLDSLQNGLFPQNKFYCSTITLGQDEFGPTLFNKIMTICDSVNSWGTAKIQWATLSNKMINFHAWQSTPNDYSQWLCGQQYSGLDELTTLHKNLIKIVDLMGRESEDKPNTTLIYIYSDGTTEKVFRIE